MTLEQDFLDSLVDFYEFIPLKEKVVFNLLYIYEELSFKSGVETLCDYIVGNFMNPSLSFTDDPVRQKTLGAAALQTGNYFYELAKVLNQFGYATSARIFYDLYARTTEHPLPLRIGFGVIRNTEDLDITKIDGFVNRILATQSLLEKLEEGNVYYGYVRNSWLALKQSLKTEPES